MTNTYFKKSRKEEKQKILKRDMLNQLKEAKIGGGHKKNKSDSGLPKIHVRNFSLLDVSNEKKNEFKHIEKPQANH